LIVKDGNELEKYYGRGMIDMSKFDDYIMDYYEKIWEEQELELEDIL
tara:strand:- start:744 stop:884 length:141 start_codon:yes stop_codon:yes gene_type:complete